MAGNEGWVMKYGSSPGADAVPDRDIEMGDGDADRCAATGGL